MKPFTRCVGLARLDPLEPPVSSPRLSGPGTVILADNLIRDGAVLDESVVEQNARAARIQCQAGGESAAQIDQRADSRQEGRWDVDLDC
jgi:hypothetical protein